jgi:tetratricopeptide (TPR) repeat protein
MSKTNVARPAALALLLVLQAPLTWGAPSAAEKAEAEALFQDAKKLMGKKRFAEACQKFEASQKLDPAGGTLLNLALCHEAEGRLATAWVEFGDALAQAKQDKKNDRIKIAREHLEKLEPRLPRLVVKLTGEAPPGLVVERDGVVMSSASFGTPIPVDPGEQRVKASAPGFLSVEKRISVAEGETKTLTLPELSPEPPPKVPAASSAPPPPPPPPSNRKTLAYIAGGGGVASLAVGTFFGLRTLSKKSESDKECPSASTCSARGVQANEEAYAAATVANIGVGLGIVGLGAAAYLLLTAKPESSASSYRVAPALGQNGGGLWMQGHF